MMEDEIEKPNKPKITIRNHLSKWILHSEIYWNSGDRSYSLWRNNSTFSSKLQRMVEISKFPDATSDPRPIERGAFSFDKQFPRFLMVISRYRAGGIDYRKRNYDRGRGGERHGWILNFHRTQFNDVIHIEQKIHRIGLVRV